MAKAKAGDTIVFDPEMLNNLVRSYQERGDLAKALHAAPYS